MSTPVTVLIVGAGPTGLTAAMELARHGIAVRIVDKLALASDTSRALAVQARTMELFEQRGLSDEMLKLGNEAKVATIYGRNKILATQEFWRVQSRFNFILMISQAETERILTAKLAQLGVQIERSVELIAFSQSGSEHGQGDIHAILRHPNGALEDLNAAYIICAEGAHSSVRRTLGLQFEGETLAQKFMLGDLHVDGPLPEDRMSMFLADHGFLALFPMGNRRFRMIASETLTTPRASDPTLEELQAAYDKDSHIQARLYDMAWSSHFAINSRMLRRLQEGRTFFGGDSAHVHSPAGGQGMNTGIQDMMNLGWKLAFVLQGQASPDLLQTYQDDRVPVIRGILKTTETMTAAISTENKVVHDLITHVAPLALNLDFVQNSLTGILSQTRVSYRESPLSTNHRPPGSVHAGDRVPECGVTLLASGGEITETAVPVRIQQLVENVRLTLLLAGGKHGGHTAVDLDALAPWNELIQTHRIGPTAEEKGASNFGELFGSEGFVILVRPDSYVGFSGNRNSIPELVEWLSRWFPRGQ